jgi:hypothetical protein
VIVIDRFVGGAALERPDQRIDRVLADWNGVAARCMAQILRDGFTHERRHARPPTPRLVLQLLVGLAG